VKEVILNKNNRLQVLQEAMSIIREGGVIVYPTETSYGLGADFYNDQAVNKVYQIKDRDKEHKLSVLVPDLDSAKTIVHFPGEARRLAEHHWPGALTFILPFRNCTWPDHCSDYLALRVSSHAFAKELIQAHGGPIIATSANISGQEDCYHPEQIQKQFANKKHQPDLFINAGELKQNKPSTIIKFIDNKAEILRQGDLKIKI
jgi:L-threonylcarbamoyladenylate synthase